MNFLDGSLFPENQDKLVITAAPYGPEWIPSDFPEDIAVTMEAQIQKAVDCYNAGATVLHLHVRELDGKGSKRLSKFNELIGIALDASCTHMYAPGVRRHIQRALKAGATKEEITAVLQLATLQGLHSMCLAGPILLEELEASERSEA